MKKKLLALVLCIALVAALTVGLVACDNGGGDGKTLPSLTKDTIKIGVLHINPTDSDSGYTFAHESGIKKMITEVGLKDSQVLRAGNIFDNDPSLTKTTIENFIAQGCNVIIGTSFGYQQTMLDMAKEYPNVYFSHGTGYMDNANMNNYFGRIYQARYLSGIVAGLKSLEIGNNKLGYVAAFGNSLAETCSGINAFLLGAQSVNPNATMEVKLLGEWFNLTNERSYADALLAAGCGIIGQHCDTANPPLAAAEWPRTHAGDNRYSVGYNSDMRKAAGDTVLTSVVWHWDAYYTLLVNTILDGKWAEFGNYYGSYADGLYGIAELSDQCAPNTDKYVKLVSDLMKQGTEQWDVFSGKKITFTGNAADNTLAIQFVDTDLKDNNGNVVVAAGGASVSDAVLQSGMHYYIAGVTAPSDYNG